MVTMSLVTLKKVYDRNVVNKYWKYFLLGVITFNLIDYISIWTDEQLFISLYKYISNPHITLQTFALEWMNKKLYLQQVGEK